MSGIGPAELERIELLAALDAEERRRIASLCRVRRFRAGEILLAPHRPDRDVLFFIEGRAEVVDRLPGGRALTLAIIEPGGHAGELAAIDHGPRTASVIAVEPGRAALMGSEDFCRMLATHPSLAFPLLVDLVRIVRLANLRIGELAGLRVVERLARELLRRADPADDGKARVIRPAPTQEQLAAFLGATRESVARALSRLQNAGLLERRGRTLHLPDVARLEAVAGWNDVSV